MGNCPITKNIFCCSRNIPNKESKCDVNLKEQKEYIYESNSDNKKNSNIGIHLNLGKLKLRTKTLKYDLSNNNLDDSDLVIHLRTKNPNIKKKKKKNKNKKNSNKSFSKRGNTARLRRHISSHSFKRRMKKNSKKIKKKSTEDFSIKNDSLDNKEINLNIIKDTQKKNTNEDNDKDNEKLIEKINNNKVVTEGEFTNKVNQTETNNNIINNNIINNNIINNNIINNINININENKIINNKININVDLKDLNNNNNNNEKQYEKRKTNINRRYNDYSAKKETEVGGNSVYIKIISEKSIDESHNIGRPSKTIIFNKAHTRLKSQDIKVNTMESNIKITMDNLNYSKTVDYNNKLNKLNKVNSSENYSYEKKSLYNKTENKTEKQSIKNGKNKFTMTCTNENNSSESIESDDSSETKIKLFEKLEKEEEDFIKNVLKSNKILMQELDDDAIEQFSEGFYCVEFQKGQILFNEGNEAKIFYIIFSGKVLIYNEGEDKIDKIRNKTNINKINNFIIEDNNTNTNPFSILHPKTIEEKNNDNMINNNNLTITNYNKHKKADSFSGKFSLNSLKGGRELIKGCYFGQECFKENEVRMQNAKVLEKAKIFCCSGEFYRNAKNYMLLKISKQRMELLNKIPLFKYCEENKLISLSKKLKESKYNYCSIIINENEMNNAIYVVKEGEIRITKKFKKVSSLQKNSYFGHINLILKKPNLYTYSIESKKAILYEIPHSFFYEINLNDLIYKIFIHAIKTSIRIKQLFIHNYKYFYKIFKLKYYQDGEIVYQKDLEQNKKLCVIISGGLKQEKTNKLYAKEEEVFGDNIIDSRENLDNAIISLGESLIFEASWNNIISSCELYKNNNLDIFETVRNLKRVKLLNNMHEIEMLEIAKVIKNEVYKDNTVISKEGELANKFYIVKKGKIKLYQKQKFIRELDAGGFFGEIPGISGVVKLFTAISVGETECYVINKKNFSVLEESSILEYIKNYGFLDDLNIELSDLFIVKSLGKGKFGQVYLVHNQKHFYAIKSALLSEILKTEKLQYYLKEKEIMKMLDFPFILRLVKTLKTDYHIFFLEEHIEGISLRDYLSNRKKENNKNIHETEFYGAILLLVLNYIHKKRIIHRDIKPDNCMIDQKGYLKVIDFGISKYLNDQDITNTVCGTPHYMAPEIISGKGYSFSADYWSFGITLFEIFYDYLPFGQGARDILDIYQQILRKKLILPYDPKFNEFNSFLKLILAKNIVHRVCNYHLLKSHPFFHNFQFEHLLNHSIKPPFIPEVENFNKNLTICNISVLDYFKKDITNSSINNIENNKENTQIKKLLEEF